jgi:glycogen synthase
VRVLIATDAFPPHCGGSGWSTWELARGLRARGHHVVVVQPRPGQRAHSVRSFDGFAVDEFAAAAPPVPFVRNYFKNERLYTSLARHLEVVIARERIDLVHAQHVLTTPPAIAAARRAGVGVVATVRDYWPVCYWSTLMVTPGHETLCPACTTAGMHACLKGRVGAAWPVALPLVPYMQANLARKQAALTAADLVIAVSERLATDLKRRAQGLTATRIEVVPNPVAIQSVTDAAARQPPPLAEPYAVYAGKLEANKGADLLPRVAEQARLEMPLVLVGDGALRSAIESEARRRKVDLRVTGWLTREAGLGWIRSARLLVFPSRGPESLSRVLIEAAALGVPAAAMDTGGTREIVQPDRTGLLSVTADELARDVGRLAADGALRQRLGAAARAHVERTFDARVVVSRIEELYRDLLTHVRASNA